MPKPPRMNPGTHGTEAVGSRGYYCVSYSCHPELALPVPPSDNADISGYECPGHIARVCVGLTQQHVIKFVGFVLCCPTLPS